MTKPKLDINRELNAVDKKDYNFYNNLSEEERKAFSPYILMRFVSSARADREIQEWFLENTNDYVNKHHWLLSKNHKELLWKLFAASGAGESCYHPYLAAGKKEKIDKIEKLLAELNPTMKLSDIQLLAKLMTEQEKEELFDNLGLDEKQRKQYK